MSKFYTFKGTTTTPQLKEIGSKAKALIETRQAGFPVPDGFVLPVSFFDPWVAEIEHCPAWADFLSTEPSLSNCADDDALDVKGKCDAVKEYGETHLSLTQEQKSTIDQALQIINNNDSNSKAHLKIDDHRTKMYAVRLSFPEEDLDGKSFAGGYETTLGVIPVQYLEKAIRRTFVSAYDHRVVQYKGQSRYGRDTVKSMPSIAVIVQHQVASAVSGVAFSLNPQNNAYDEAVINANLGLGESIVNGKVVPDTYVVDKVTNAILERKTARKETCIKLNFGVEGGTREVSNETPDKSSLADDQVKEIVALVFDTEKHYDKPMDIEFAIDDDNTLCLLQARPITTYFPLFPEMMTVPGEDKLLYLDYHYITQGFPDCMSVLGMSIGDRITIATEGKEFTKAGRNGIIFSLHGRRYMNVSTLTWALGVDAFYNSIETWEGSVREIFGPETDGGSVDLASGEYIPSQATQVLKAARWHVVKGVVRKIPGLCRGYFQPERALSFYLEKSEEIFDKVRNTSVDDSECSMSFLELVDSFSKLFDELMKAGSFMGIALAAQHNLSKMFPVEEGDDGCAAKELLAALQTNLPGNPTSEMGHFMCRLASFPEVQETKSGEDFEKQVESGASSEEFLDAYREFVDRFGCRCMREIDVSTPRPYENLAIFFNHLKQIDTEHNATVNVEKRSEEAYKKLLSIAREKGQDKKYVKQAKYLRDLWGYREHPKYMLVFILGALRRRALYLGSEFQKGGRLDSPDDIFHLTAEEISLAEKDPGMNMRTSIENNLAPRRAVEHVKNWPKAIDSRGKIYHLKRRETEHGLACDPISPGLVRGHAKVLRSPYEKTIEKGDICPFTWFEHIVPLPLSSSAL